MIWREEGNWNDLSKENIARDFSWEASLKQWLYYKYWLIFSGGPTFYNHLILLDWNNNGKMQSWSQIQSSATGLAPLRPIVMESLYTEETQPLKSHFSYQENEEKMSLKSHPISRNPKIYYGQCSVIVRGIVFGRNLCKENILQEKIFYSIFRH